VTQWCEANQLSSVVAALAKAVVFTRGGSAALCSLAGASHTRLSAPGWAGVTTCGAIIALEAAMNAIDMLTRQHREMEGAFSALLSAKSEARAGLFERAADTLMSHILVEEQHFYPAVKAKKTEDVLLESLEEHLSLKRVLADLVALSHDDPHFEPKLHVLKEQAEHHHKEEEEHLFPKVKKLLHAQELEALGDQMQTAQSALLASSPRKRVAEQTAEASNLP
jgi:hemerythrin superfamily protein